MNGKSILIVDDEQEFREFLSEFLRNKGFDTEQASSFEEAEKNIHEKDFNLALIDLIMPGKGGIEVMKMLKGNLPDIITVIMTGYASIETAVEAMRSGAFDYVTKPFNLEEILLTINRALELKQLRGENILLKSQLKKKYDFENIIGDSEPMQKIFRLIEKVADTDSTVLIKGESGTGKELVARALHYNSKRRNNLLVPVNCGAIPEELLESELFGHVKGAFTGAIADRPGRFEIANGGTIFLDEIGDMSPKLQVKLLRILQSRECDPIGSTKTKKVDVRVIAATNQNLEALVESKLFREDLFYRLNVIPIYLPPLRDRTGDIPLLVNYFLTKMNAEKKCCIEGVDDDVIEYLAKYSWPGNVRELENLLERIVIINSGVNCLKLEHFPEKIRLLKQKDNNYNISLPEDGINLNSVLDKVENNLILQALEKSGWVKEKAARLLNINRTTLVEKLKRKDFIKKEQ